MPYTTVESICKAAIRDAFRIYSEAAITDNMIQQAVDAYNASEPFIWREWPWHNRKVAEISISPDADGIITFDGDNSDVDMIRAVKAVSSDGDSSVLVWHEDAIRSAINGRDIGSDKFDHLEDDSNGNRRIKVNAEDGVSTYKIMAFRRFIRALGPLDPGYDANDSSANANDYRVLTWKIDRVEAQLISFISDELKKWKGGEGDGKWNHGINKALKDIREQEASEQLITPDEGSFGEMGFW